MKITKVCYAIQVEGWEVLDAATGPQLTYYTPYPCTLDIISKCMDILDLDDDALDAYRNVDPASTAGCFCLDLNIEANAYSKVMHLLAAYAQKEGDQ